MIITKRKNDKWDGGELDTALQMWRCAMIWDGNVCSKTARDSFVDRGYAIHKEGFCALTGRGKMSMLHPRYWLTWLRIWRNFRRKGWGNSFRASYSKCLDAADFNPSSVNRAKCKFGKD